MKTPRLALLLCLLTATNGSASASTVIEPVPGERGSYSITLEKEGVDSFLAALSDQLGIPVVIKGEPSASILSGRFEGPLTELLPRLLRQEDVILLRSKSFEESDGISKILVLRPTVGARQNRVANAPRQGPIPPRPDAAASRPSSLVVGGGAVPAPGGQAGETPSGRGRNGLWSKSFEEMSEEERRIYLEEEQIRQRTILEKRQKTMCMLSGAC